jgi:hypothetical protein
MITLMADYDHKQLLISQAKLVTPHFQLLMLLNLQHGSVNHVTQDL